jgi:hypothetical protein
VAPSSVAITLCNGLGKRFGEKALGRGRVLLGREKEVEGGAGGIHRPIKVTPLAFHPDVRLVHAPAVIGGLQVAA